MKSLADMESNGEFVCPECNRSFPTAHGLGGHLSTAHQPLVPCPRCGKQVRQGVGMTQHMRLVHGEGKPNLPQKKGKMACPECGKMLGRKDVSRHLREVHHISGGLRPYLNGTKPGRSVGAIVEAAAVVTKPKRKPLTAAQITRTTCAMLWPDGVPLGHLEPLLHWHERTVEFLEYATPYGQE